MSKKTAPLRASRLAALLMLGAGPVLFADPAAGPVAIAAFQQPTPSGERVAGAPDPRPKGAPRSDASDPIPAPGASRNPFHPHTSEMLRQSNRLKAKGYVGKVINDGELSLALDSALRLVGKADRETRGHRTKAIQQIDLAVKLLGTKAAKSVANSRVTAKAVQAGGEPKAALTQAQSDVFLREAKKSLAKTLSQMNSDGNARRHAPARAAIQKAIEELDFALEGR